MRFPLGPAPKVLRRAPRVRDRDDGDVAISGDVVAEGVQEDEESPAPIAIVLDRPAIGRFTDSVGGLQHVLEQSIAWGRPRNATACAEQG